MTPVLMLCGLFGNQCNHALFRVATCVRLKAAWLPRGEAVSERLPCSRADAVSLSDAAVSIFGPALIAPAGAVHVPIRVAVTSFAGILFNFRWA